MPDTAEHTSTQAPAAGQLDDAIAQLAGDDIDKLLSMADLQSEPAASSQNGSMKGGSPSASTQASATQALAAISDEQSAIDDIDKLLAEASTPTSNLPNRDASTAAASAAATKGADSNAEAQALLADLDAVFASTEGGENPTASASPPSESRGDTAAPPNLAEGRQAATGTFRDRVKTAAPGESGEHSSEPPSPSTAVTQENAPQSTAPETHSPAPHPANAPAEISAAGFHEEPGDNEAKLPVWLIPLELVNRPFAFLPDPLRDALGKAAILTFFNAAGILVYVMRFRKHHP